MTKRIDFDWARAALGLYASKADNLTELVHAAGLDPRAGDVAHLDLSDVDLRWEDLSGWDLSFARFDGALIAGTNFEGAKLDPSALYKARDWSGARFDRSIRDAVNELFVKRLKQEIIDVGAGQVSENVDIVLSHIDEMNISNSDFYNRTVNLANSLKRNNAIFEDYIEEMKLDDTFLLHQITFQIDHILEKEDVKYIINIFDNIFDQLSSRDHTFYDPEDSKIKMHFDAYYPGTNTVIEVKDEPKPENDDKLRRHFEGLGFKVIVIHKSVFKFDEDGTIARDLTVDRATVEQVINAAARQVLLKIPLPE